jgi:phosphatidylglycerophosphate synthase
MQSAVIWILFALMLLREVGITVLRDIAFRRQNILIASSRLGKLKMFLQTLLGSLIIVYGYFFMDTFDFPVYLIAGAMVLILAVTYLSAFQYVRSWISPSGEQADAQEDEEYRRENRMVAGK